ncbi:MAG: hypothetical protein GQ564_02515 [Bacteroidales bacterium]|nr:hypothetical protein [Bacteroidales bacterium]
MPTTYISTPQNTKCKVIDFKDVTFILNTKERINYISFKITNNSSIELDNFDISLPFCCQHISEIVSNAKECLKTCEYTKFSKLQFTLDKKLEKGDSFHLKTSFKITFPKSENILRLHFYNLRPIVDSIKGPVNIESPPLCTKTMKIYAILPKRWKERNLSASAETYTNNEINGLKDEILGHFNHEKNISNEKNWHRIFEWSNCQLNNLEDELYPDSKARLVRLTFYKKDSLLVFGYPCSMWTIVALTLSLLSIALSFYFKYN